MRANSIRRRGWKSLRPDPSRRRLVPRSRRSRPCGPEPRLRRVPPKSKAVQEGKRRMKFSFCVMANIDEIGFFSHAEALGYDSVWVADSQHLFSDVYAVLALAA